ncbi:endosomal transmembrane epsin interactor 1 isoform X2 [Brachyhypopomus gauderio]|uniref:endosomal transmembrane epsin interactor 1 isoform X2 n=1 Tax=Brachyhypopomus gauderio TaxID=698409 RepID=UPI0040426A25
MSLPVVLPGSCCRFTRASSAPHFSDSFYRRRDRYMTAVPCRAPGPPGRISAALLPGRPLLSVGLLQLVLGCSMVALSFGALSLSTSPPITRSCPFWAGSSVILSGIIGLTTWKRPMVLLSERADVCNCCTESPSSQCQDDKLLRIYAGHSCGTMRILLKKVLFALCALNALTTAVCLIAAGLRYLQIFSAGRPCTVEVQNIPEEGEEQPRISDPEEFVAPAPPPSYFSAIYSCTPRLARRMFGDNVIPLPHIYGARIKGVEVFCPLDPPPPYEAVVAVEAPPFSTETAPSQTEATPSQTEAPPFQGSEGRVSDPTEGLSRCPETDIANDGRCPPGATAGPTAPTQLPIPALTSRQAHRSRIRRSNSDPVLLDLTAKVMSCEVATQTDVGTGAGPVPVPGAVTLRRGRGPRRPRPSSMVDFQSYRDTQLLVAQFLQQSSTCSLTPEVQELIDSITTVLRSDEEHMDEVLRCACLIDQVMAGSGGSAGTAQVRHLPRDCTFTTLPLRKRPALLHLRSCGDLSTFTWTELHAVNSKARSSSRSEARRPPHERPHSLIGVSRETVI